MNQAAIISKPRKLVVPLAEALRWRAGGDYLLQIKMDGRFAVVELDGYTLACEQMKDGTHFAHSLLAVPGQSLRAVNLRATMPELRRLVPQLAIRNSHLKLCPEFSGGEGLEALLADGHEGGCAKFLDEPYGAMLVAKRVQVFYCRVIGLDASTGGVWLVDRDTNEPRGKLPLRGNKFEQVRGGSILKVEAFGLTAKRLLREGRPDSDGPGSWLVRW